MEFELNGKTYRGVRGPGTGAWLVIEIPTSGSNRHVGTLAAYIKEEDFVDAAKTALKEGVIGGR